MPVNFLILHALKQYYLYYGNTFEIECPTGSGKMKTLDQVAEELERAAGTHFSASRGRWEGGIRRLQTLQQRSPLARFNFLL
jgi:hypothetical protein